MTANFISISLVSHTRNTPFTKINSINGVILLNSPILNRETAIEKKKKKKGTERKMRNEDRRKEGRRGRGRIFA